MIRRSIPLSVKCNTCKCPNEKGGKYVYEKEEFIDETGFHGVRLKFKCMFCLSDITIKTEPNIGYVSESGAECWRKFSERCKDKLFRGAVQPETDGEEIRDAIERKTDAVEMGD